MALVFDLLRHDYAFAFPEHLSDVESWQEHIPFAFALISAARPRVLVELGTHKGDSYGAFCQAVKALDAPTHCYAVDTWQGDEHAGIYGDDVLASVKAFHDLPYSGFSTLLRKTFDDAVGDFADGSVDVLHIDGLHTYDAVRHDFESWQAKLSPRAIVLFHDTTVQDRDFGVWKFWQEVTARYPGFEFIHGNGLGVLAVGAECPSEILDLCRLPEAEAEKVRTFYGALGARIRHAGRDRRMTALSERLYGIIAERDATVAELADTVAKKEAALEEHMAVIRSLEAETKTAWATVQSKEADVATLDRELQAIKDSRSWQMAMRLQNAARRLRLG